MTDYINGKPVKKKLLNEAINYAAKNGKITKVKSYSSLNTKKRNYDRYDKQILAWTNYWNDKLAGTEEFENIDPNVIKAIMYVESKMGYHNPRGNADRDVMQALFPGDPSFWVQSRINYNDLDSYHYGKDEHVIDIVKLDGTETVASCKPPGDYKKLATEGTYYGLPKEGYGLLKSVIDKKNGDKYIYKKVTPNMSIAFGVRWYAYKLCVAEGNEEQGIKKYNDGKKADEYLVKVKEALKLLK